MLVEVKVFTTVVPPLTIAAAKTTPCCADKGTVFPPVVKSFTIELISTFSPKVVTFAAIFVVLVPMLERLAATPEVFVLIFVVFVPIFVAFVPILERFAATPVVLVAMLVTLVAMFVALVAIFVTFVAMLAAKAASAFVLFVTSVASSDFKG